MKNTLVNDDIAPTGRTNSSSPSSNNGNTWNDGSPVGAVYQLIDSHPRMWIKEEESRKLYVTISITKAIIVFQITIVLCSCCLCLEEMRRLSYWW